jgi:hypothetical protein
MTITLDLKKKFELNLKKAGIDVPILQARAAIDKSGSMEALYLNGWVSSVLDLFIGAALKFDDNGELEVGFFEERFEDAPVAVEEDGGVYMSTKGKKIRAYGGTKFAPIVDNFENWPVEVKKTGFFGKFFGPADKAPVAQPRAYVGIITDGVNTDRGEFEEILKKTSGETFYQFIGIGHDVDTPYLSALSKHYPQIGFVHIPEPTKMTPDSFYEALCNPKFAAWI